MVKTLANKASKEKCNYNLPSVATCICK